MRHSKFKIETYPNNKFEGFTNGEDWNGWACPYFTFEESQKIVEAHKKTGQKAGFYENSDEFYFEIQDEKEIYPPIEFEGKKLYPIGNSSWIWKELQN